MKNDFYDKLIYFSFRLLFFFTPLILFPSSYELFEFNKMVFVYFLTTVIIFAWLGKIAKNKTLNFRGTALDLPLCLFLITQVASTIISIDRHTSIFGYYSRFNGGLLSTVCYCLLYWAMVSNLNKDKIPKLIKTILVSGFLVSIYGIAEHFGIDKNIWVQDVQNRVFSTLGQPNWLAAYLDVLIFIVLSLILKNDSSKKALAICCLIFAAYYSTLLFTKSRSGFLGFIIPFMPFLIITLIKQKNKIKQIIPVILITVLLSIIVGLPFNVGKKINISFLSDLEESPVTEETERADNNLLITPSSDIRKIVWRGAVDLWKKYPILGTGVETFAYAYYWVRPAEHNLTSEWDFLYNKAHNEFLNFAACSGTLGLLTYLFIYYSIFKYIFKKKSQNSPLLLTTCYLLLSIFITNFFGFSVVPIAILFFLVPGLMFLETSEKNSYHEIKFKKFFPPPVVFLFSLFFIFKIITYWLADFYFARGITLEKAGYLDSALAGFDKAIKLSPIEPNFYAQRGTLYAKIVSALVKNNQEKEAEVFIQNAENDCAKALSISPYHINFYKSEAKAFYYLAFYKVDYLKESLETLALAEKLAPTDPKITYNMGLIYQTLGEDKLAREYLEKTLNLKPDYASAQKSLKEI